MGGAAKKAGRFGLALGTGGMSEVSGLGGGGGLGGKGGSGPSTPDFMGVAQEQIRANRPNQNGPFGSTSWSQDPQGNWTQNVTLSPDLQAGAGNLMTQIGQQGPVGTGDEARQQAIDAAYGQASSRLDPMWSQREESLRSMLAAQGLDPGSEAFGAEMSGFGRDRNDAYTSALNAAIGQGTAAGHIAFQDNLAASNDPYQKLASLQGLSQPANFMGASGLVDALASQYQGDLNKYGQQQAGKNSMQGGLTSLAALAMLGGGAPAGG